ncbi:salivary glue protein Sgs-3-like [Clytia hemisphaerica]|uniref:salivary glue protein Sgs-3-like n=1 Tax=Clytia hemisphaerica TaxID=252671 RepID=UPI0034D4C107
MEEDPRALVLSNTVGKTKILKIGLQSSRSTSIGPSTLQTTPTTTNNGPSNPTGPIQAIGRSQTNHVTIISQTNSTQTATGQNKTTTTTRASEGTTHTTTTRANQAISSTGPNQTITTTATTAAQSSQANQVVPPSREQVQQNIFRSSGTNRKSSETVTSLKTLVEESDKRTETFFTKMVELQQKFEETQKEKEMKF